MTHSQLDEIEAHWRAAGRKSGSSDMETFYYSTVPKLIGALRRSASQVPTKARSGSPLPAVSPRRKKGKSHV